MAGRSALQRLLAMRGEDAEEMDETVAEYVAGLIEEYLGGEGDGAALRESCTDFVPGLDVTEDEFFGALKEPSREDEAVQEGDEGGEAPAVQWDVVDGEAAAVPSRVAPLQAERTLHDVFPSATLGEVLVALSSSRGDVAEATERMVQIMELAELAVKDETRRAEAVEQERACLEAARERALSRYNRMGEAAAQEKGKTGAVVDRAIRARDAAVDKEVSRMVEMDVQKRRYINNEVVAHKGERFLYQKVKSKNSVPEDPGSFVGLKIVAKGKRGPSPKFK